MAGTTQRARVTVVTSPCGFESHPDTATIKYYKKRGKELW